MTDAPHRIWLHKMPTGIMQANYAISDTHDSSGQVEYIRADLVDAQDAAWCERVAALEAAVAVARAEGMREAARFAKSLADQSQAEVGSLLNSAGQKRGLILVRDAARVLESVIFAAAEGQK